MTAPEAAHRALIEALFCTWGIDQAGTIDVGVVCGHNSVHFGACGCHAEAAVVAELRSIADEYQVECLL